jgi:hypothetical protein
LKDEFFSTIKFKVNSGNVNIKLSFSFLVLTIIVGGFQQKTRSEPWTLQQLLAPADLAKTISDPKAKEPIIFSIGPGAIIKGSINIGPAKERENLEEFKKQLKHLPKDANIVIYCGCCPFDHCPNIRPAFSLMNEMKFKNHKLLNLQHNVKVDWIDKGYPTIPQ